MKPARSIPLLVAMLVVGTDARAQTAGVSSKSQKSAGRGPSPAAPTPLDQAKALTAQAELDYKVGKFEQALDGYTKAYEVFPTPALLFNLGQCHKLLKNYERATFFFRGYLRDKPDAPNRAVVEGLLADAQKSLDEEQAQAKKEADDKQAAEERSRVEAEARAHEAANPPPPPRSPVMRIAGIALGGVGLAAIGTGIYFGVQSHSAANQIAQLSTSMGTWSPFYQSLYSQGQGEATAATILYIAGGAALATGAFLTVLGWPKKSAESATPVPTASFAPSPGGGSFVVHGAF
jgi:tetratricopeptide (TPR) repeat protein